ncbi:MAG: acyl-CoA dehydrogenase family protein [Nesterenkonia sp.]|uniref:acyl-CoA dehydrogenase family protein n=1 Tax=Nesterenkonia marinintestina TaxID=2979865 RepID=UPI0021C20134|nr:acyl-CoA dehydrogenase family protein [Nesterenkonia sp. GX14115]MDO5492390.1 acyl-CoA dehydrogenase family protein [Nesterenkonia sp.]
MTHTVSPAGGPDAAHLDGLPHVDLFDLRSRLDAAERTRLETIETHLEEHVRRQTIEPWNREEFAPELLPGLGALGLGEVFTDGSSLLFQGLAHAALARCDLSISALIGIHNELNVGTIEHLGSEAQRERWLPRMKRLESLGAFCLTEPEHGSDIAGGLETSATLEDDGWVIRGTKRWIGAGTLADVALVWARDTADDEIRCFLVPTDTPGYRATKIGNKIGLRIMQNADIVFDDVRVPQDALLPGAQSFGAANDLLRASRAWVGWQAVGAQQGLLEILRRYTLSRHQFGRPLAKLQLIQQALSHIAGNLAASIGMMSEVTRLQEEGRLEMMHAAMAKATTTRLGRESAAMGRDAMGGNGIVSDFEMAKMMNDLEAIYTYEGTYGINSLIVGRGLTGLSAFV